MVFADQAALADYAAAWIAKLVAEKSGPVALCLAGGSTPQPLYARLAGPPYRESLPWARMHCFFGDERFVPADDPRSNARMARGALLDLVAIPRANIHAIPTEVASPDESAQRYKAELKDFYGASTLDPARPLFDVTLLGLGEDGHTASLFPGARALEEKSRWVVAAMKGDEPRVSLTYPALNASRAVAFLVVGEEKAAILKRALSGDDLPAARVKPTGELFWLVDQAAADGSLRR